MIERGELKLNCAPTDLLALAQGVIENQRSRATAKHQNLILESGLEAISAVIDPGVMVQIIENLVSNAVKYSPPGKDILVRLRRTDSTVRLEVQDHGPGLNAEDQKKLFGKFARLSAKPTGGEHSTGLGLSIVKTIAADHQGHVWAEGEPDYGTKFSLSLPIVGALP